MARGLKQKYEVFQKKEAGFNSYNQPLFDLVKVKEIEMIVVIKTFNNVQEGLTYTTVQHLGLTMDKSLEKDMIIKSKTEGTQYTVEFVNNIARLAQITLKEVK